MPAPTPNRSDLALRLFAELTCLREEAQGHPQDHAAAESSARATGGKLLQRIHARAAALPGSTETLARLRRLLSSARWGALLLWTVAALAGTAAAALALGASPVLSVPLVLLVLVGVNLLMLLLWLGLILSGGQPGTALLLPWRWLAQRLGLIGSASDDSVREVLPLLLGGARGRYLLGTVLHLAWLSYTVAGLIALALLLALREYTLSWQTTLLNPDSLHAMASALSWLPGLLGAPGPETLAMQAPMSAVDRQGWAQWLLLAVLVYGAAPRALAALLCALLARRALAALGSDLARPGFARLRARLLPDHRAQGVIDAAPASVQRDATAPSLAVTPLPLPTQGVHALSLEWPQAQGQIGAPTWQWLGEFDDPRAALPAVTGLAQAHTLVQALVIALRASATPDRGLERAIQQLAATTTAPVWIALGELPRLRARGSDIHAQRIDDWRRLAARCGVHGPLEWDAAAVSSAPA